MLPPCVQPPDPNPPYPGPNPPRCRPCIMDAPTVVVLVGVLTLSSFLLDSCCSCKLNATMASIISIDGLASQKTDHGLRTPDKSFFSTYPKCFGQLGRLAKKTVGYLFGVALSAYILSTVPFNLVFNIASISHSFFKKLNFSDTLKEYVSVLVLVIILAVNNLESRYHESVVLGTDDKRLFEVCPQFLANLLWPATNLQ